MTFTTTNKCNALLSPQSKLGIIWSWVYTNKTNAWLVMKKIKWFFFFAIWCILQGVGVNTGRVCYQCVYLGYSLIHSLSDWSVSSKPSKHYYTQTVKARELKFWENDHPPPSVTCHVSSVRCQVLCVRCHMSHVRCHMSGVMCQVSHVRCHVSADMEFVK